MSAETINKLSVALQPLASSVEKYLHAIAGERIGFVVVLNAVGVAQYVSNLQRDDGKELLGTLLERWNANKADTPALYNPDLKDIKDGVPVRRVVCAAIRRKDGGAMVCSARHFDEVMNSEIARSLYLRGEWVDADQGFIDQFGVFMTRQEAWTVANAAGQIVRRVGGDDGCLYSENLY